MNVSTGESPPAVHPASKRPIVRIVAGAAVLVGIAVGVGVGAAANSHSGEVALLRGQITSLRTKLTVTRNDLISADSAAANARAAAASATAKAQAQAKAQWAAKISAANALLRKLQHEQGIVLASTISADGVYVVGKDIPSGTYHTSGGGQCYYATLSSTNTFDIIDNNNFNGPETVDVSGAYAFEISGGCTWVKE